MCFLFCFSGLVSTQDLHNYEDSDFDDIEETSNLIRQSREESLSPVLKENRRKTLTATELNGTDHFDSGIELNNGHAHSR